MAVRTNLCTYPSFELDANVDGLADGWAVNGTVGDAVTYTTPAGRLSGICQRFQQTTTGSRVWGHLWGPSAVGSFAPDDVVTMSFYIKGTANANWHLHTDWFWRKSDNAAISQALGTVEYFVTTSWVRVSVTLAAAPALTSRAYGGIYLNITSTQTVDLYIDDVLIEKAAEAGTYFDGATTGAGYTYAWSGTANASTSTETPAAGLNTQVNIGEAWKAATAAQINIGGTWKPVTNIQQNIGGTWKVVK